MPKDDILREGSPYQVNVESLSTGEESIGGGPTATRTQSRIHLDNFSVNSGEIVITGIDNTFSTYIIELTKVQPDSGSAASIKCQTSSDGGSTFDSASGDYHFTEHILESSGNTKTNGNTDASAVQIAQRTDESDIANFTLTLHEPANSNRKTTIRSEGDIFNSSDGVLKSQRTGGVRAANESVDSLRVFSLGDGFATLYGVLP